MAKLSRRAALIALSSVFAAACAPAAPAQPTAAPKTEAKPAATTKPAAPAASPAASPAGSPITASQIASPPVPASPVASPSPGASPAAKPAGQAAPATSGAAGAWPPPRGSVVAQAPAGKAWTLGIVQFVSHPALDATREGALKALADNGFQDGQNLKVDYQNGQGDVGTVNSIAQRFKDANPDLVIAIATPPFQAMLNVSKGDGKPRMVFSSIADPYAAAAGVIKSPTDKPAHVTGMQALAPVEDAMRLAKTVVPSARRYGMIWNPTEANSEVVTRIARESAPRVGVELIEQTVSKADEVLQAAQALVTKGIDIFFISTDSTVVSAFEAVVKVANENKKPLFANDPASASRGAAAALGIDYEQVGYESGQQAAIVLSGQKTTAELPVERATLGFLAVNTAAALEQGVTFPPEVLTQVRETFKDIVPAKR